MKKYVDYLKIVLKLQQRMKEKSYDRKFEGLSRA